MHFYDNKNNAPHPLVSGYQVTGGSLSLPVPAARIRRENPHLQGPRALAEPAAPALASLQLSGTGRGPFGVPPRGLPAVGTIQIQPMATCKQTWAPPSDE